MVICGVCECGVCGNSQLVVSGGAKYRLKIFQKHSAILRVQTLFVAIP